MIFENENTYIRALRNNTEGEFDRLYDEAVQKIQPMLGRKLPMIIDGQDIMSENVFEDRSPINTDILISTFPVATEGDVSRAVDAAHRAYNSWRNVPYEERAKIIIKAGELMRKRKYELCALLSYENGKNRYETMAEVDEGIDFCFFYAITMLNTKNFAYYPGKIMPESETRLAYKPYGVFAVVPPFNFPVAIFAGLIIGPVLAGNTVVVKPSSDAPTVGYEVVRILHEAGVPGDVLSFVTGGGASVGNALIGNPKIEGVAFTGSKDVGMNILHQANKDKRRPVISEMGGKNAIIVSEKADLKKAVLGVYRSAFGFNGQKCSACSRVLIHKNIKEVFLSELVELTKKTTIGHPVEKSIYNGPVINKKAFDKFKMLKEKYFSDGNVLTGGNVVDSGELAKGYYVEPTIIDGLPRDHYIVQNELFLPILAVVEYEDLDDAISFVNSVEYGLTGGIFSTDVEEVRKFERDIEVGVFYINRVAGGSTGAVVNVQPFVGWKLSGTTGIAAGGPNYLKQFLREQSQTYYDVFPWKN